MQHARGRTLLELLIASSLLATVTVMTIPGVAGIIHANRRTDGQWLLLDAVKRQKRHLIDHYGYARNTRDLGFAPGAYSPDRHYRLEVIQADQGSFRMRAIPTATQLADYNCGYLQIDERGRRESEHGGDNCWR